MILNFKHKGLRRLFEADERRGIRPDLVGRIRNILAVMNRARSADDLKIPGCMNRKATAKGNSALR